MPEVCRAQECCDSRCCCCRAQAWAWHLQVALQKARWSVAIARGLLDSRSTEALLYVDGFHSAFIQIIFCNPWACSWIEAATVLLACSLWGGKLGRDGGYFFQGSNALGKGLGSRFVKLNFRHLRPKLYHWWREVQRLSISYDLVPWLQVWLLMQWWRTELQMVIWWDVKSKGMVLHQ